jgi:hypothetical protein
MERTQINEAIRVWRKADDEHRAILSLLSDGDNYSLGFGGSERTLQGALMSAMDDDLDIYVFFEKDITAVRGHQFRSPLVGSDNTRTSGF